MTQPTAHVPGRGDDHYMLNQIFEHLSGAEGFFDPELYQFTRISFYVRSLDLTAIHCRSVTIPRLMG